MTNNNAYGSRSSWQIAAAHHIADGDHRIIWDPSPDDGTDTARLMQWSDDEDDFIEIDSEVIEADEDPDPYDAAELALEARNGLHDVISVWWR